MTKFALLVLFAWAAAASASESFSISPSKTNWEAIPKPLPGIDTAYYLRSSKKRENKSETLHPNITVFRDTSAIAYASLDDYLQAALKILQEQNLQKVISITKVEDRFVIVQSRKDTETLAQAIYFKKGYGFYVVTATAASGEFARLAPEFNAVLRSGRFQ
ncbi:MAG: hypothetical protein NDJ90_10200 [Oligoflexia bacterium]|nr:hypothetical protein [Oligoflexia bacterium]